jgi:hypothetical protein
MSFNGSGTFLINTAGQPVVSGTVISSTAFNALTADLATGLSTCLTKDGQTTPTANIPMGNNKVTGLGAGTDATDAANLSQVQSTVVKLIGSVSGTNTITGSMTPSLAAYATGQMFYFVAAGDNTSAVTLNINSLGAKNVTKNGSTALTAGEIKSGQTVAVIYDGTRFQIVNPAAIVLSGTTGSSNTTYGVAAAESMTSATGTVAVGVDALTAATSSSASTAVGYQALLAQSTGNGYNTAVGYQSCKNLTTSDTCTFIGAESGLGITSGKIESSGLGFDAGITGNYSGITCLGANAVCTGNNQVQLGASGTTTYAYGAVQDRSDARDKADIQDSNLGLAFVMQLQPRMYRWDMREDYRPSKPAIDAPQEEWDAWHEACKLANLTHDGTHKRNRFHYGLVAQEVKATMDAMGVDFGGYQDHKVKGGDDVLSLGYEEMIAPLIKAIQELKAEFDAYKATHP